MKLVYKQLFRQLAGEKVFLFLLYLLTMLTSLSFFFVMFSVDGNMAALNAAGILSENRLLYKNALISNTTLAYRFLVSMTGLTAFVFIMFFYRFFKAGKRQIGCIKALGFRDRWLRVFFVLFTLILSAAGAISGLLFGYFMSDILLNAYVRTYMVTGLIKEIGIFHLLLGLTASTAIFCLAAFWCYGFVKGSEDGALLAGGNGQSRFSAALRIADQISKIAPSGKRLSLRIALRKPLSVLLLFAAVLSFNVCILLGRSLNLSSQRVFESQTEGRYYEYDIKYSQLQTGAVEGDAVPYLEIPAAVRTEAYELERTLTGLYRTGGLYELKNADQELLSVPEAGYVYINPELSEIYGVKTGDTLKVNIRGVIHTFYVADLAENGDSKSIYINGRKLAELSGAVDGAYNGVLSTAELPGDKIITRQQRIDRLNRDAVSNQVSGVINQVMGVLAGAIIIFLALYLNFQDNTHDMMILIMTGYRARSVRKMLVDVYLPVLWTAFAVTLVPGILMAEAIQKSLSVSTNDYMPFGVDAFIIAVAFAVINIIYQGVQVTFGLGIKRTVAKSEMIQITAS